MNHKAENTRRHEDNKTATRKQRTYLAGCNVIAMDFHGSCVIMRDGLAQADNARQAYNAQERANDSREYKKKDEQ